MTIEIDINGKSDHHSISGIAINSATQSKATGSCIMTILTVTTAADTVANDGKLSLREAVTQANAPAGADTIRFASSLAGKTLTLSGGELVLTRDVTIDGDRDNDGTEVTLSGGDASRILHITGSNTDVSLRDLSLTRGHAVDENGGAIYSAGHSLRMTGCTISNSSVGRIVEYVGAGGGIFVAGNSALTLSDCTIRDCSVDVATQHGGAIYADSGSRVVLADCAIIRNDAERGSGIFGRYNVELRVRDSLFAENIRGSAIELRNYGSLVIENSKVEENDLGILLLYAAGRINDCSITQSSYFGVAVLGGDISISNSTITESGYSGVYIGRNSPKQFGANVIVDSTITGNDAGIYVYQRGSGGLALANDIVSGNNADVFGTLARSNGHNILGSDIDGAIVGDLQGIAPSTLFAAIDPDTGGGQVNDDGIVPLRNTVTNPALSGGDPLVALPTDQLGHVRPQPAGSLPDIGAAERNQALSTSPSDHNDVLTGTDGIDAIGGKAGADLILGRGGNDSLHGEGGSDLLDGGPGNDLLDGGDGIDLARFGGSTAVTIDLVAGTARRGSEIDTLTSIQGAIGSSAADSFKADGDPAWFQGGLSRDVATGGAARDLYDFDHVQDSLPGSASRDVITDFAPRSDRIDLTGIDADATQSGNQAFTWVGSDALTGPGQLGYSVADGNLIVRGSTDGDSSPEFAIQLTALTGIGGYAFFL